MSQHAYQTTRSDQVRTTVTPNAVMTTLASPTLAGTTEHCLWQVAFEAGASGPEHVMDSEQVWFLESGAMHCQVGGKTVLLGPGDSIRLAGGVPRRFHAVQSSRFMVCGTPGARATTTPTDDGVVPPWIV